jgi:hypothetical protein
MRRLALVSILFAACTSNVSGTSSDDDGSGSIAFTCMGYCTANVATCTGSNTQWGSMQNCLDTCSHWAMGASGDTSGDSLGCRIYHTMAAETDAITHCPHAGPTGGSMCGTSTCATFCPMEDALCSGVYPAGSGSCTTVCPTIATNPPFSANDTGKNDIECRFYHLTAAATDPTTHCPHTAQVSPVCTE